MNQKVFMYFTFAFVFGLAFRLFNSTEPTVIREQTARKILDSLERVNEVAIKNELMSAESFYWMGSYSEAFVLYERNSNKLFFNPLHMEHLAMLYEEGKGCVKNEQKSQYWYARAGLPTKRFPIGSIQPAPHIDQRSNL
jgi:hypothetical protein